MQEKEIRSLFCRAAKGEDEAFRLLDKFYFDTDETKQLDGEARECFLHGLDKGSTRAPYMLAKLYIRSGTDAEKAQCPALFRRSIEAGHTFVLCHLGYCYEQGIGVEKDTQEALSCYLKAAKSGQVSAWTYAAQIYLFEQKDYAKGIECYEKAADEGYAFAAYALGVLYELSEEIPHDAKKSIYWYRRAGQLGNSNTDLEIANIYAEGKIIEKDMKKAVQYYKLGCAAGDDDCMTALALCLLHGDGIEKDETQAIALLEQASKLGNEDAKKELLALRASRNEGAQ